MTTQGRRANGVPPRLRAKKTGAKIWLGELGTVVFVMTATHQAMRRHEARRGASRPIQRAPREPAEDAESSTVPELDSAVEKTEPARTLKSIILGVMTWHFNAAWASVVGVAAVAGVTIAGGFFTSSAFSATIERPAEFQTVVDTNQLTVQGTFSGALDRDRLYVVVRAENDPNADYRYTQVTTDNATATWIPNTDGAIVEVGPRAAYSGYFRVSLYRLDPDEALAIEDDRPRTNGVEPGAVGDEVAFQHVYRDS